MIIIDLPIYLFILLIISLLVAGIVMGIIITSWYVRKELQKTSKNLSKVSN